MHIFNRSYWTSIPPMSAQYGEVILGQPYFEDRPTEIEFIPCRDDIVHLYHNPSLELQTLIKSRDRGVSDLDYNFAIGQNTDGIYTVRGFASKAQRTKAYKVLVFIGEHEEPTDQLKKNVEACKKLLICNHTAVNVPNIPLQLGNHDIHVFNLIEYLYLRSLYTNRNDALYGPFVEYGVKKLQDHLGIPMTGSWDRLTIDSVINEDRSYIHFEKMAPVG